MRKLFLIVAGLLMLTAQPALAEHNNRDMYTDTGPYDGVRWNESHTEYFCISPDFYNVLTNQQEQNVVDTSVNAFSRWQANTNISVEIRTDSTPKCNWNLDFRVAYENAALGRDFIAGETIKEDFCEHRPDNQASSIQYEDLSWMDPGIVGFTFQCDVDNNGYLDYFVIVIDYDANAAIQWGYADNPDPGEFDYLSLVMHEVGHAYGFNGHWSPGSDACDLTVAGNNVMCSGWFGYYNDPGNVSPGTVDRTLESHDIGETNQNYPG